jgi:hypothetical protein
MSETGETEQVLQAYGRFADLINKEDARVADGLKWGFVANGALVSFIANQIYSEKSSVADRLLDASHGVYWQLAYSFAICLIAFVAWALTWASYDQVRTARRQIIAIRQTYERNWSERVQRLAGLPHPYGSRHPGQPSELRPWWPETFLRYILIFWWLIVPASLLWLIYGAVRFLCGSA